jgi:phosphotransferase system enzyme I (PtsI)
MAGDLQLTRLLLGLGLREFSMHPSHLLGVKQRVLQTDISAAKALIGRIRRVDEKEKLDALMIRLNA